MEQLITGIHHVTAIVTDARKNLDFYTRILGMRLVKKTVNFDAPEVYHFYYGDANGSPGSLFTVFPYAGLAGGRHGKGMLNTTAFSVPGASLDYWIERLQEFRVPYKPPAERLDNEVYIYFEDPDGVGIELVFNNNDLRTGYYTELVPEQHCIRGIHHVEIWEEGYERTAGLLTGQMDHRLIAEKGNRFRFAALDSPGNYVDLLCTPDSRKALAGSGTVHHLAFNTPNAQTQLELREKISNRMLNPTPVQDRNYFTSVYFREPGGVLFEVATSGPGFAVDEPAGELGSSLKLPERFEPDRQEIERKLPLIGIIPGGKD